MHSETNRRGDFVEAKLELFNGEIKAVAKRKKIAPFSIVEINKLGNLLMFIMRVLSGWQPNMARC